MRLDEPRAFEDRVSAHYSDQLEDEPASKEPPKGSNPLLAVLVVIVVSLMVAAGAIGLSWAISNRVESGRASASQSRGVVDVVTRLGDENLEAAGTGIVLTPSGVILTNNHVISGATSISVTDATNGASYSATVIGYDVADDVALLQATGAAKLSTAAIGSSSGLAIGEAVIAVGNAGGTGGRPVAAKGTIIGLDQIITAEDRLDGTSETLAGLIETNANVVAGDSGGPLLSSAGQVVGLDTAAASDFNFASQGNQSFAIPINAAVRIATEIRSGRPSTGVHIGPTAFLGVGILPGVPVSGAMVTAVLAGTPAAAAGLRAGDIIVSVGGAAVASSEALSALIGGYRPGAAVVIGWVDPTGTAHSARARLVVGPPL